MTDFPPADRDRWLKLVKRDPNLRPEGLLWDEGWRLEGAELERILQPEHAAALCRDAMVTLLNDQPECPVVFYETGTAGHYCVSIGLPLCDKRYGGSSRLSALLSATESAMDAKETSDG